MKPTLLHKVILCLFISTLTFSQTPPDNNTPDIATVLTVGTGSCGSKTAGDLTNATNSGVGGEPLCGTNIGSDVWYTAEMPASGNLAIETFNVGSTYFDSVLTVYTKDDTDTYTEIGCDDDGVGTSSSLSKLVLSGQTAGATVYIRVWGYEGERGPFEICAWNSIATANDTPTTATALTVGSGTCSGNTRGNMTNASNSGVGGEPMCGTNMGSDVWYTAEMPASGNLAIETFNVGSTYFDSVLTVYTKDDTDTYTEVACDDQGGATDDLSKVVLSGQTAGTTLYIRVWGYEGERGPFEICAWNSIATANDTPTTATALTVGSGTCSGNTRGNMTNASNSGVGGEPMCGTNMGSDVWYTAEMPASGNLAIETFNVGSTSFNSVLTAYTKDSTDVYTEIGCDDDGVGTSSSLSKLVLSGQTAGATVYIRVWGYEGDRDPFEICAWNSIATANDTPTTATALTVGSGTCSGNTRGNLTNASSSGVGGEPMCGEDIGSDVWYTAEVPASGNLTIETFNVGSTYFDSVLTAYTKDNAGVYTEVDCNDDDEGGDTSLSKLVLSGQSAGTTVYIRVWGYEGKRDSFEICAWEPAPLSTSEINEIAVRVYPIPAKNILKIDTPFSLESATVYSLTGKQLLSFALDQSTIDVSSLPSGVYMLHIIHDKGNQHVKFIKE